MFKLSHVKPAAHAVPAIRPLTTTEAAQVAGGRRIGSLIDGNTGDRLIDGNTGDR